MKRVTAQQTRWKKCPVCQEAQATIDPETHRCQNCGYRDYQGDKEAISRAPEVTK